MPYGANRVRGREFLDYLPGPVLGAVDGNHHLEIGVGECLRIERCQEAFHRISAVIRRYHYAYFHHDGLICFSAEEIFLDESAERPGDFGAEIVRRNLGGM